MRLSSTAGLGRLALLWLALACGAAWQTTATAAPARSAIDNSPLDAELFFQLFVGEIELRRGEASVAYQRLLEAARRSRDERLYQRAVEIAVRARANDQAVAAVRSWRSSLPQSRAACETQAQLMVSLGRIAEAAEPLRSLIELTPLVERAGTIAALPRLITRGVDAKAAATMIDEVLTPYRDAPATRASALVASGRNWLAAGDAPRALAAAQDAQRSEAASPAAALLALELMPVQPAAEAVVKNYLATPGAVGPVRMTYVRRLTAAQRLTDAVRELQTLTADEPQVAAGWLTLGALHLELTQPREAEAALKRYLAVAETPPPRSDVKDDEPEDAEAEDSEAERLAQERTQAYLMLAQAAEQQKDFNGAQSWLEKAADGAGTGTVIARRAALLARQGKVREARELVRTLPERTPEESRTKLMTESQVLRDVRQWKEAYNVLVAANQRFPDDGDLLYEQAMMAEKLERLDEMEALLRKVMQLRPDHHHAYNALGYSLADRNRRLPEARKLVAKALELAPGDPFITDSLGWVEFRLGNREEALRLLREAYAKRPDTEIAAHLGEVLWAAGQRDEARRIWREGRERDSANDVLKETLARLKVQL